MFANLISLVLGGSVGVVARWGLHRWVDGRIGLGAGHFPWGILVVNLLGCFGVGWLYAFCEGKSWATESLRLALFTGFLGSFTTFSTFGWNTFELIRGGQMGLALTNAAASVILGLVAVWGGFTLGR